MPGKARKYWLWFVVVGVLMLGIILTLGRSGGISTSGIAFRSEEKSDPEWERTKAAAAGAIVLRQSMRNPDSFKLARVLKFPNGAICYEYRAQNGLGGTDVERAVLPKSPAVVFTKAMGSAFSDEWSRSCLGSGTDVTDQVEAIVDRFKDH